MSIRFGYQDRTQEEVRLTELLVICVDHRIRVVTGIDPDGNAYRHPSPETLAYVIDRSNDRIYPSAVPGGAATRHTAVTV